MHYFTCVIGNTVFYIKVLAVCFTSYTYHITITFVKFTNYKMYIFTVCTALKHSFFKLLHVNIIGVFDVNM